ncbi:MAG: sigma-54-dependent Fis family transcriptional regulator, partial [Gramella sp.]|nr:sigma-54-dependent Fis family transcriptional regulator [Christiangramia sp.]
FSNEREILYKVLFDMKNDLNDLKKLTLKLMQEGDSKQVQDDNEGLIQKIYGNSGDDIDEDDIDDDQLNVLQIPQQNNSSARQEEKDKYYFAEEIEEEETLSLQDKELELIKKSLERHSGKRKAAAEELGISERTLYRKIKQYNL